MSVEAIRIVAEFRLALRFAPPWLICGAASERRI
jgi:hypothetical protein